MGVHCFEKKRGTWRMRTFPSVIFNSGLQELAAPAFPPTYKFGGVGPKPGERVAHDPCVFRGLSRCLANSDGKPKHNPAWTDRILIKSRVSYSVLAYEARPLGLVSDHIPVVARINI